MRGCSEETTEVATSSETWAPGGEDTVMAFTDKWKPTLQGDCGTLSVPWVSKERRQGEEQIGDYQNYGSREDSRNGGRVLPILSGFAEAGGGQLGWDSLGTVVGPLICWKPVWFSRD